MKNGAILIALLAIFFTPGCKPTSSVADITVDIDYSVSASVPSVTGYSYGTTLPTGGLSIAFPAIPVATSSSYYINQYHTTSDKIVSVSPKSMVIQIVAPAGQNFDFLDSVQIYLSGAGLQQQLLAYKDTVAKSQNTLTLNVETGLNIKSYFILDTMYITANMHVNAIPQTGTVLNANSIFTMVANPLY